MNKFRKLGFVDYSAGDGLAVHSGLSTWFCTTSWLKGLSLSRGSATQLGRGFHSRFVLHMESQEIARAIMNAAIAASPPISSVWSALRKGRVPVKRPLI